MSGSRVVTLGANTLTEGCRVNNSGNLLEITGPGNATFTNVISGGGGLVKAGAVAR